MKRAKKKKKKKKKKENGKERGNLFIGNNLISNNFVAVMKNTNEYTNSASAKSFRCVSDRYELSYSFKKKFSVKKTMNKSNQCFCT